ncbi:Vacuolar membrane-associated protein IML1 [Ceratobasidium theobromae]|uniref:ATP-dependent DNA helicase n=1 Tax=Ceratobasidium theobromae TaxID=1582974 RepID=A0A5N5Q912_9AGAM|nr:Vacuolar membrane-associated protein IML1 [Ceratobasidium theobromae]
MHNIYLSTAQARSQSDIISAIHAQPAHIICSLRDHLVHETATCPSSQRKRKRCVNHKPDTDSSHLPKRTRCSEALPEHLLQSLRLPEYPKFLEVPTPAQIRDCHRKFLDATSNDSMSLSVCVACACECSTHTGEQRALDDIPNSHQLVPSKPHFAHKLTSGLLLVAEKLEHTNGKIIGWFCHRCLKSLSANKRPSLAWANQMWIGPIPEELAKLTVPEQILVSLYHPRCWVYKLYPRDTWSHARDETMLQRGLVGNVTTFEHNLPDIVKMLEGHLVPRATSILASTIVVTYIGPGKPPKDWLKQTFRVRRQVVYSALYCLKYITRHPGYQNLEISEEMLAKLPVDDIPLEILSTMMSDPEIEQVQHEADTYLPTDSIEPDSIVTPLEQQSQGGESCGAEPSQVTEDIYERVPDAIPMQYLGAIDTDMSKVSAEQTLLYGLVNLANSGGEGGYAVRHSRTAVNEFPERKPRASGSGTETSPASKNYSVYAFPYLYPYGEGGIEGDREVPVSATEHVRCNLQYYDHRFSTHPTWPFTWFSILQKRQEMIAARVQMRRHDFDRATQLFSSLTQHDLSIAAEEEANGKPISNPVVQSLRRLMHTAGTKVMGSDASRYSYRSCIWSMGFYFGPPSLWVTINPTDLHNPLMQVMAGEKVDLDNFQAICGPDADRRAKNVAKNPYAAAKFFHLFINLVLETLFGIQCSSRRVTSESGVLGKLQGYFGVVEAQGRGSLHLHMLLWLHDTPSSDDILSLLQTEQFRQQVIKYIDTTMRAHLDGMTEDTIKVQSREPKLAWSRPPNPNCPNYETDFKDWEQRFARAQQVHVCKRATCLKYNSLKNKWFCKRRAPFPLSPETVVQNNGTVQLKRTYGYINAWNPSVLVYGGCNNDIKFISNGAEARAIIWYITAYQTKKQCRSHNISALLAERLVYHFEGTDYIEDMRNRSRLLLFRCLHSLNRQMEQSGQQVMSYLLGYGDTFRSHTYVPLYWAAVAGEIFRTWPNLKKSNTRRLTKENPPSDPNNDTDSESDPDEERICNRLSPNDNDSENVTVERLPSGKLTYKSQLIDYQFRGHELEDYSLLSFIVDTWETNLSGGSGTGTLNSRRGAPQHIRVKYLEDHPKANSKQRILRAHNHNALPNIVGSWLPRNDDLDQYDFYCASMLALLKPWRRLTDLEIKGQPWAVAFGTFLLSATKRQFDLLSGAQYYYQCRDAAEDERDSQNSYGERSDGSTPASDEIELDASIEEMAIPGGGPITEQDIEDLEKAKQRGPEATHGAMAVGIARHVGLLPQNLTEGWEVAAADYHRTTNEDIQQIQRWKAAMTADVQSRRAAGPGTLVAAEKGLDSGSCVPVEDLGINADRHLQDRGGVESMAGALDVLPAIEVTHLNRDQLRAFKIVERHLDLSLNGEHPPQLLMQIQGEGGTGKSTVIHCITDLFHHRGVGNQLIKSAPTGIAASLIDGNTLHSLCHMSAYHRTEIPNQIRDKLHETWKNIRYLIIDEISMVSRTFFAQVSAVIAAGKKVDSAAFGGINVIISGDFHQFPPVACPESEALYAPKVPFQNPTKQQTESLTGRAIYEQFRTVVLLKEQELIVSPEGNGANSIASDDWKRAVLVTPRHGVRIAWNKKASQRHCAETHQQLFICPANDTIRGRPLTLGERYAAATKKSRKKSQIGQKASLPDSVELAIGLEVMVTTNVETELDVANGACGVIQKILFDPKEQLDTTASEVTLNYLPLCVLVKLNRTKAQRLPGLEEGVVPIVPIKKNYDLPREHKSGGSRSVTRWQLPMTSAYAFTDYQAQGQTIERVVVDIARPPSGRLTQFNAYVALSRSKGRDGIRLLRDFDSDLFQTVPSYYLQEEGKRLQRLDQETQLN